MVNKRTPEKNALIKKTARVFEILKEKGVGGVWRRLEQYYGYRKHRRSFRRWLEKNKTLSETEREDMTCEAENFACQPLISVLLPVYDVEEKWLRRCVESVINQVYENWELCVADDCSPSPRVKRALEEYAGRDSRIKVIFRDVNGHISAASNSALSLAAGEFTALLDHDDELTEDALFYLAREINLFPEADLIYSDEDMIDEDGRRYDLKFKPDWSPSFFYSLNLTTHLAAFRTEILRRVGGFRSGCEGSQDYDLVLRFIEEIPANHIRHIPRILYHWRAIKGSVALDSGEKPYAHERARQAIREHFQRRKIKARVEPGFLNLHRVFFELPKKTRLSLIFSTGEKNDFFENKFLPKIEHRNFEVIFAEKQKHSSRAEQLNDAAKNAAGDVLIFIEDFPEIDLPGSIEELAAQSLQPETGAVGAKILKPDGSIRHAGVILGINGLAGFANRGLSSNEGGYYSRLRAANNFSAVSGGILCVRREVFEEAGGFDERNFPSGLYDIDLCLRLSEKGFYNVFTPFAVFVKNKESATEKIIKKRSAPEVVAFKRKWKHRLGLDPFYNPNLSRKKEDFSADA